VLWFRRRVSPVAEATLDHIQRWAHPDLDQLGVGFSRNLVQVDEEVGAGQERGHDHVEAIAKMQSDCCDGETPRLEARCRVLLPASKRSTQEVGVEVECEPVLS